MIHRMLMTARTIIVFKSILFLIYFEYDKASTTNTDVHAKKLIEYLVRDKNGLPKIMEGENQITLSEMYEWRITKKTVS